MAKLISSLKCTITRTLHFHWPISIYSKRINKMKTSKILAQGQVQHSSIVQTKTQKKPM